MIMQKKQEMKVIVSKDKNKIYHQKNTLDSEGEKIL